MDKQPRIDISYRNIGRITAPVLVSQISYTAMGVVDTLMVGRLGVTALAAVGLGNYVSWWPSAFVLGMITGVTTLVAQAVGAGKPRAAGVALFQGIYLALLLAAGLAAGWLAVPALFERFGTTPEVAEVAVDYMRIRMLGGVGFALMTVGESFFRGIGRTTVLMWCGFGQLALNCCLNYLLIFGNLGAPRLGPQGAAWGTCAAQLAVGLFLLARVLAPAAERRRFGLTSAWRFDGRIFKALVRLSLPIGVQYFMEMGGVTVFCAVVARLGEAQMAATNVAIQVWSLTFTAALALGIGATTLVGQSIGAGHPDDARSAVKRVLNLGYGITAVMGTLYLTVPDQLMALFVKAADLELVRPFARPVFLIVVITMVFDVVFHVLSGAMRGSGDTKYPMWVVVGTTWLLWVPAILVMAPIYGLLGAWSCVVVHVMTVAGLLVWRYRGEAWLKPPVEQADDGERPQALAQAATVRTTA